MRNLRSPYGIAVPPVEPPPPLMLVMLPPAIAQKIYEMMVASDAMLEHDLAAIRRKHARRLADAARPQAAPAPKRRRSATSQAAA